MEEEQYKYQLVIIGYNNKFKDEIVKSFYAKIEELNMADYLIILLNDTNFFSAYKYNNPTVCLYFGENNNNFQNEDILDILISNATLILPVVNDLSEFADLVPEKLKPINGFRLSDQNEIEPLVSRILEGFNLLRISRRIFISYRRSESASVAIQLYEYLDEHGFDVFLDTHSILPGDNFQDELWHRMVDTDVVLLLDTPGFLEKKWTKQELVEASTMSIQVLQLIWPNNNTTLKEGIRKNEFGLFFPKYLDEYDFNNNNYSGARAELKTGTVKEINSIVEMLRARGLAARQNNLIKEFLETAKDLEMSGTLQPQKFIMFQKGKKEIAVIPAIGVPHAVTYNQTEELIKKIRKQDTPEAVLIYDHRNIKDNWLKHLKWLDDYLPVKTIKITHIEEWMKNL